MSLKVFRCSIETNDGGMAEGRSLHIEIGKLVLNISVAWR